MSKRKLCKYLEKPVPPIEGHKQLTPLVLTDSKAKYLIEHCTTEVQSQIRWRFRSGQTTQQGFEYLQKNIDRDIGHLDNIHIYIWLGTCDLTDYDGTYINLSSEDDIVSTLTAKFRKFIDLLNPYPACRITFLEIPPYSILEFNKTRKHEHYSSFKDQDNQLLQSISKVNEHIREINQSLNTFSPNFGVDVSHHHTVATSKSKKLTLRDQYYFDLYEDGVHPKTELAQVWLKKISLQIQKDCWS